MRQLSLIEAFYLKGKIEGRKEAIAEEKEIRREIGRQEIKLKVAKKLKQQGITWQVIADVTELSIEKIESL